MELTLSRKDAVKAIKVVGRATGKSSALPVLSNVLISTTHDPLWNGSGGSQNDEDSIYLAATDMETGICARISGNRMKVSASSAYVGDGCEEMDVGSPTARKEKEEDVDRGGDDVDIAVNVHYLMDALRVMDTQDTLIGIDDAVRPMVIRPSFEDYLCVLMPVRLST